MVLSKWQLVEGEVAAMAAAATLAEVGFAAILVVSSLLSVFGQMLFLIGLASVV